MMNLSRYEEKIVRAVDKGGRAFTGRAVYFPSGYGLHEFDRLIACRYINACRLITVTVAFTHNSEFLYCFLHLCVFFKHSIMHGRLLRRKAELAAAAQVSADEPDAAPPDNSRLCSPYIRTAAQPPGPGFPEHAPSV